LLFAWNHEGRAATFKGADVQAVVPADNSVNLDWVVAEINELLKGGQDLASEGGQDVEALSDDGIQDLKDRLTKIADKLRKKVDK